MKLDDICKKQPFIYEVDEEFYFLGQGVCRRCDSKKAIGYFKEYREILNEIGKEFINPYSSHVSDEKYRFLVHRFKKVMAYSDITVDKGERAGCRETQKELFDSMTYEQKEELLKQLNDFVNVFRKCYIQRL